MRRRVWPWLLAAAGALAAGLSAAHTARSLVVALGGGFVAAQLVVPRLLLRRRVVRPRWASARPVRVRPAERRTGRSPVAAVAWVRLAGRSRPVRVAVVRMTLAPSARHTS